MIRPTNLLLDTHGTIVDQLRIRNDQTINDAVRSLGITAATETLAEGQGLRNALTLSNGEYGGFSSEKDLSIYKGMGAASIIKRRVVARADCIIDGIHFIGSDTNNGDLVFVHIGATVIFRNCVFEKRATNGGPYIQMGTPVGTTVARANFIGCVFSGPSLGAVINNPGIAANVNTVGCYDKTGGGFGGTTAFGNL
jgi:hypothetical protein